MADIRAAWGIDIGQAGLKAVRLEYDETSGQLNAVAFDFVPHPKILSQPDANPEELVKQALDLFLSRNNIDGDLISISVPGQTALARFIQLPPVEASKVPEIVKYEARQQIPFALEDVIWDYQPLGNGTEEGGFMLDAEVGLFAMKRDQVQQHLDPFLNENVEVETIQIAPLALYNYLCYDQLGVGKDDPVDPDADYTIVLDMGADNTTLLVTNGQKIWLRNVPIGGNHFTRALTKELKLTFAKAEHLKCNATKSPDPRSVFQALRPVFNDYVAEIQRSIGFFSSVNKDAKIEKIVGVGNGFKLAGLQKFLQQNLQYQVDRVHAFESVSGDAVLRAPLFQDNIMSFAVPYGLALQSLDLTPIHTSLLPPEIITERLIRKKKPWVLAVAALLLVGLSISALGFNVVKASVSPAIWKNPDADPSIGSAEGKAESVKKKADGLKTQYSALVDANLQLRESGDTLVGVEEDRIYWPELYKAINECLPRDVDSNESDDPTKHERVKVEVINVRFLDNLQEWYGTMTKAEKDLMRDEDKVSGPVDAGYLVTLDCVHFYDNKDNDPRYNSKLWIRDTILENFKQWTMQQKDSTFPVGVRQIGITHPTMVFFADDNTVDVDKDGSSGRKGVLQRRGGRPGAGSSIGGGRGFGRGGRRGDDEEDLLNAPGVGRSGVRAEKSIPIYLETPEEQRRSRMRQNPDDVWKVKVNEFTLQFVWRPIPFKSRLEEDPNQSQVESAGASQAADGQNNGENEATSLQSDSPTTTSQPGVPSN